MTLEFISEDHASIPVLLCNSDTVNAVVAALAAPPQPWVAQPGFTGGFGEAVLIAYSSTNKVYGDLEWLRYEETTTRYTLPDYPNGLNELLPLDFSTPYGCSKGAADQYVRDWARLFDMQTVVF